MISFAVLEYKKHRPYIIQVLPRVHLTKIFISVLLVTPLKTRIDFKKQFKAKLDLIIFSSSILRSALSYILQPHSVCIVWVHEFLYDRGKKNLHISLQAYKSSHHILLKIIHMLKKSSFIMHFFLVEYCYEMEFNIKQFSCEAFKILLRCM